jgi:CHAT domain
MNACHSARREPGLTRTDGWAERFLEFGSSAFVGANWEVLEDLACRFACTFYEALRTGDSIGAAVQTARTEIRKQAPANSTWLSYSLYGHPNATVKTG